MGIGLGNPGKTYLAVAMAAKVKAHEVEDDPAVEGRKAGAFFRATCRPISQTAL